MTSVKSFALLGRAFMGAVLGAAIAHGDVAIRVVAPRAAASVINALPDVYLLGPGDLIGIDVFNVPEYGGEQRVLANGQVNLPAVGQLSVVGLTIAQAEQAISDAYGKKYATHG